MAKTFTKQQLEKLYGKVVVENQMVKFKDEKFFGDKEVHEIPFDVYDGFAYCEDYNGEELFLSYPKMIFLKDFKEIETVIRQFADINDKDAVTVVDILHSYCSLNRI